MSGPNYIRGDKKRCNGPLHKGKYISLTRFWTHKRGHRKGKPFSQCIDCENFQKWGNIEHGLVPYKDVNFIFDELVYRIGKTETARRIGVSNSFFYRRDARTYQHVRKATVVRAMVELKKCRDSNEARHRKSIRHGAAMRGHIERIPTSNNDFNGVNGKGTDQKKNFRYKTRNAAG